MIKPSLAKIQKEYKQIQQQFKVEQAPELLSGLTSFAGNDDLPIHHWFHFKEGFSANLLGTLKIETDGLKSTHSVFLDPFCGSGTTVLAGDIQCNWAAKRIGFEINPFLAFVSRTKANWRAYDPEKLHDSIKQVLRRPLRKDLPITSFPTLSSFHDPRLFSRPKVSQLVDAVNRAKGIKNKEKDLLLLGIASAAERLGFYRKDGRALRILSNEKEIRHRRALNTEDVLREIWEGYEHDLLQLDSKKKTSTGSFKIINSDGRTVTRKAKELEKEQVDLIAYSPPYLNHIDYTEVYKIELWLLGFITTTDRMKDLRKRTLRSHGSYSFKVGESPLPKRIVSLINLLADEIEKNGTTWHKRFRDVALGYFEDMQVSLKRQLELLRPGKQAICVVANSAHGSRQHRVPIATDLLISVLAHEIGFEVTKIIVARRMSRRDTLNIYLRESILILTKPVRS